MELYVENEACLLTTANRRRRRERLEIMSTNQEDLTEWNNCEPGLLQGHAGRMHRRQLLQLAVKAGGASVCVAAVGLGSWWVWLQRAESDYQLAGLTCSDVRELMPAYRVRRLDLRRSQLLERHVRKCSNCAALRSELRAQT